MNEFTFEEMNLMAIYNSTGTKEGLIAALTEMRGYLEADETELLALTDTTLEKLDLICDEIFEELNLVLDFN